MPGKPWEALPPPPPPEWILTKIWATPSPGFSTSVHLWPWSRQPDYKFGFLLGHDASHNLFDDLLQPDQRLKVFRFKMCKDVFILIKGWMKVFRFKMFKDVSILIKGWMKVFRFKMWMDFSLTLVQEKFGGEKFLIWVLMIMIKLLCQVSIWLDFLHKSLATLLLVVPNLSWCASIK